MHLLKVCTVFIAFCVGILHQSSSHAIKNSDNQTPSKSEAMIRDRSLPSSIGSSNDSRRKTTISISAPTIAELGDKLSAINITTPRASKSGKPKRKKSRKNSKRKKRKKSKKRSNSSESLPRYNMDEDDIKKGEINEIMPDISEENRKRDSSVWGMAYCSKQARRKSSYYIGFKNLNFDEETFDVIGACNERPTNPFEIGKIIDVLRGKKHGWSLQEYLFKYNMAGITSPIFEISHPTKGTHLVLGVYPRLKEATQFLKYHPIIPLCDEYNVDTIYTPTKYTRKSGFNYSLQTVITSMDNVSVHNLNVIDEEYSIINKEFLRQCEKLFDKILYGKGVVKRIPGIDSIFITHWNTFMRKYRVGVEQCYLNGDLKGYMLLVSMFWSVVLRFKKENRCKDLSKVLSRRMSYRICRNLENKLNAKHTSITLVSLNLLFRPHGTFEILKQNGWDISTMDEDKIMEYRKRNNCGLEAATAMHVRKVGKHAAKVMNWSRNKETCLLM